MPTIEEFAGKAALQGKTVRFETGGLSHRLVRIDDSLYYRAHEQSVSIQEDHGFYLQLWREEEYSGGGLGLAETYVALTMLLGESSESYDDWKCSFSFPCLLEVQRESGVYGYALHIVDIKGGVNYLLYKLLNIAVFKWVRPGLMVGQVSNLPSAQVANLLHLHRRSHSSENRYKDDQRFDRRVIQKPFAEEFSRAEINHFIAFMTGYLEGYFGSVKKQWHKWFFRTVQCEGIVYGYQRGRFFNRQYQSEAAFRKAIAKAEAQQQLAPPTNAATEA